MSKTLGLIALTAAAIVAAPVVAGAAATAAAGVFGATTTALLAGYAAYGLAYAGAVYGITSVGSSILGLGPNLPKPDTASQSIKSPIPPRVYPYGISRLYGAYILYETTPDIPGNILTAVPGGYAADVYAIAEGRADAIVAVYLNDDLVTLVDGFVQQGADGRYRDNTIRVDYRLGLPTETAYEQLVKRLPDIWTENHRGDGVVTAMLLAKPVKGEDFLDIYPNGVPVLSLVGRWQLVFDPRDPTQDVNDQSTWKWSENAVLHLLHYLIVRRGYDYATEIAPALSYWIAAANDCDSPVPLKAGGTEPRYRSCVAYKSTDEPKAVLSVMLSTFDGWLAPRGDGALVVYSGRYYTPTVTIGPDEIVSYRLQSFVEDEQAVNELVVSYVSAAHDYNTVDTTAWRDEDDIARRGKIRSAPFSPQTPSYSQNRRLAKRQMARTMAGYRGSVTTNLAGRVARGQRYVNLQIVEGGVTLFSGPVEIISLSRDFMAGGVTFDWVAADPNVDAWNPATEEGEPAPVGERVAGQPLAAPSIISASADFSTIGQSTDETGNSVTGVRILIVANGPVRDDLTWYARWRVGASAPWNERAYPDSDPGPGVSIITEFVPYGTEVEVAVAYSTGDGRTSPWSPSETVDTSE